LNRFPVAAYAFSSVSLKSAVGLSYLSIICPASNGEHAMSRTGAGMADHGTL